MRMKTIMRFKKGDIVTLVDNRNMAADIGALATVTHINSPSSNLFDVKWNERSKPSFNGQNDGGYFAVYFKLATLEWDTDENNA